MPLDANSAALGFELSLRVLAGLPFDPDQAVLDQAQADATRAEALAVEDVLQFHERAQRPCRTRCGRRTLRVRRGKMVELAGLNPRPQAFYEQFYMCSDLIWFSPAGSRSQLSSQPAPYFLAPGQGTRSGASQCRLPFS